MKFIFLLLVFFAQLKSFAQLDYNRMKITVENLETTVQKEDFWNELLRQDQEVLLQLKDKKEYDFQSFENMIYTALLFEIHGTDSYPKNNMVAIVNLSHSQIADAQLAYWPIILNGKNIQVLKGFYGQRFPAYMLESVSLTFYNYSLVNQENIYPKLLCKLEKQEEFLVSEELFKIYERTKYDGLKVKKVLGKWKKQSVENFTEEGFFEFVLLSDGTVSVSRDGRFLKLLLKNTSKSEKLYQIENEPFGWQYKLSKEGNLSLLNEEGKVIIAYSKAE